MPVRVTLTLRAATPRLRLTVKTSASGPLLEIDPPEQQVAPVGVPPTEAFGLPTVSQS